MSKQTIGIGAAPNDNTGDILRDAFDKVNDNFTEVYNKADGVGRYTDAAETASNIYAGSVTDADASLAEGYKFTFTVDIANTGAITIDLNSLGATAVKKVDAVGAVVDLASGDLVVGNIYEVNFNGSEWQIMSGLSDPLGTVTSAATDNYIPKMNGALALENSLIYEDTGHIALNDTTPVTLLDVNGDQSLREVSVALGANQNNYAGLNNFSNAQISATIANIDITGLTGGQDGLLMFVENAGASNTVTLTHEDAASTAANRFYNPNATDLVLEPGYSALYKYSTSRNRFVLVSENTGGSATLQTVLDAGSSAVITPSFVVNTANAVSLSGASIGIISSTFNNISGSDSASLVSSGSSVIVNNTDLTYTAGKVAVSTPVAANTAITLNSGLVDLQGTKVQTSSDTVEILSNNDEVNVGDNSILSGAGTITAPEVRLGGIEQGIITYPITADGTDSMHSKIVLQKNTTVTSTDFSLPHYDFYNTLKDNPNAFAAVRLRWLTKASTSIVGMFENNIIIKNVAGLMSVVDPGSDSTISSFGAIGTWSVALIDNAGLLDLRVTSDSAITLDWTITLDFTIVK